MQKLTSDLQLLQPCPHVTAYAVICQGAPDQMRAKSLPGDIQYEVILCALQPETASININPNQVLKHPRQQMDDYHHHHPLARLEPFSSHSHFPLAPP